MIITRNRVYFDTEMDNYRERYKRIGESDWFKEHYAGKSLGEVMDDLSDPSKLREAIDETDKSPRYTKWEIENRLYTIIDNETIFPPGEDMGSAYKLLNKFLEGLE